MALLLSIVTPAAPLIDGVAVDAVVAPGREGEFGVLPGHEAFLAALRPGVLRYRSAGREERVAISGGFAEVTPERVTILARSAEAAASIDREQAEARLRDARAHLERLGSQSNSEELARAQDAVAYAQARADVRAS